MKLSSILFIATIGITSAFESNLNEEHIDSLITKEEEEQHGRKLFFHYTRRQKFDKYLDIHQRCCGDDLSGCKCPVREFSWFGIKKRWDKKCDTTILMKSSITALALAEDDFSTLASLLKDAGLATTLAKDSEDGAGYTVFAPTNAAFEKLGDVDLTEEQIKQVLLYHVVPGTVTSDMLSTGQVGTLNGQELAIDVSDGVKINEDTSVTTANVLASNGVVHVIDTVLVPDLNWRSFHSLI